MPKRKKLLQSEIEAVQAISTSASEAAKLLNVHYITYKKWAEFYGIHKVCKEFSTSSSGKPRKHDPYKCKKPLDKILRNEIKTVQFADVLQKLIRAKLKEEKCENCGWSEARIIDNKVPLILDFIDGDKTNFTLENLRILCYNCTHNIGRNIWQPAKKRIRNPAKKDQTSQQI